MYCIKSAMYKNATALKPSKNFQIVKGQFLWTTSKVPRTNYEILGVREDATIKEIKNAYFDLCKKTHPDKNSDTKNAQNFMELNEAYNILISDRKRSQYDNKLRIEKYYAEGGMPFDEVKDTVNYAPFLRIFILIVYVMGLTQFGKKSRQNGNLRDEWRPLESSK
ncbi:chaperone protein DnaJ-like [Ostrea edulis]|uniref:chaperone protein DnaJ-like n=1 Tax=Ostrea edulis TaxID=37623 RepID=UPI0024AEE4B4|nr:chaperone protein DnaJ-like [Ostrea edulis]